MNAESWECVWTLQEHRYGAKEAKFSSAEMKRNGLCLCLTHPAGRYVSADRDTCSWRRKCISALRKQRRSLPGRSRMIERFWRSREEEKYMSSDLGKEWGKIAERLRRRRANWSGGSRRERQEWWICERGWRLSLMDQAGGGRRCLAAPCLACLPHCLLP